MGAWGTSLYSNDTACDVRGDYVDKLKRGKKNEEAIQELIGEYRDIMGDIEEEPLFWYAIADTLWNYGRLIPEIKEKALFYLEQKEEMERWKESGRKQVDAWRKTLDLLRIKLETPQPEEKKVTKYRFFQCKWGLGDVIVYRFSSDYSKEKGFEGKYTAFRKVSEASWWPGHIVPVVQIYKWMGNSIPSISQLNTTQILSPYFPSFLEKTNQDMERLIKLVSESEKAIPRKNLTLIGNLPGDDLIPFLGHKYWTGYPVVGWESSKLNNKFEHFVIDRYLAWR